MTPQEVEFVRLCDMAIVRAESAIQHFMRKQGSPHWIDRINGLLAALKGWRDKATKGALPLPTAGGRLGLSRGISEWGLDDACDEGAAFYDACWELENFYSQNF